MADDVANLETSTDELMVAALNQLAALKESVTVVEKTLEKMEATADFSLEAGLTSANQASSLE